MFHFRNPLLVSAFEDDFADAGVSVGSAWIGVDDGQADLVGLAYFGVG